MSTSPIPTSRLLIALVLGLALATLGWLWFRDPAPGPAGLPLELEDGVAPDASDETLLESEADLRADAERRARNAEEVTRRRQELAHVRGRVLDEGERGIPAAQVRVLPIDPRGLRGAPYADGASVAQGETDAEGAFHLPTDAQGFLRVVVSAPGRATVGRRITGPGAYVTIVLPRAAQLRVLAVDPAGGPVPDAEIAVHVGDSRAHGQTDAAGAALFDTLPPGSARLRVGAAGRGTVVSGPYVVRVGEATEAIVIVPPGVTIQGTLRDAETGSPLSGASVHVAHPGRSDPAEPTGSNGRFGPVPGGAPGERVFVAASAEGYAPALLPVVLGAVPTVQIEVPLHAAEAWSGRVEDARGKGIAGVRVAYTNDGIAGRAPAETTTDASGAFRLPPPPPPAPGRQVILFAESSFGRAALALRPGSVRPDPLVLRLFEGGVVRGSVRSAAGSAQAGVEVRLTPTSDQVRGQGRKPDAITSLLLLSNQRSFSDLVASSDAEGRWVVRGAVPGTYRVFYRWSGGSRWREEVLDVSGPSTDAGAQVLGAGARIVGRTTDRSGQPVAGVELRLTPEGNRRSALRTTSDPSGWFQFPGVGEGAHALRATLGSLVPHEETIVVEGTAEQRVDVQFDAGTTFRGRVLTPAGAPYRGILRVSLRREGSPRADRTPHGARVRDGTLEIEDLPTGRWIVEVEAGPTLRGGAGPVDLDSGRATEVTIQLVESLPLEGQVVTSSGRPSAGATIGLMHQDTGRHVLVDADTQGAFKVAGLAAGTWTATVRGPGGAQISERIEVAVGKKTRVRLQLAPAGAAQIEVRGAGGAAVAEALVLFHKPDGALASRKPIRTDRGGAALAEDLPIERLMVEVRTLDGRRGVGEIYIAEGEVTNLQVTVRARR